MRRDLNNSQNLQTTENIQQIEIIFRQEQAYEIFTQVLLSNSIYAIAVLILSFELNFNGNMLCAIYCIYSKLFLQIMHQLYFYKRFASVNIKYNHALIRLLQIFFEGCYVLTINMYTINGESELFIFSNIFPVINIFLSLIVKINEGNQFFKESVQQINLFYVFRNICILLISIFFCLKIEGYFDIQWLYTLWMFWLLFSISTSIVVYYIFVVLALCIQIVLEQSNSQKQLVITNIWILLFLISCSSMILMIPLSVLNHYYEESYDRAVKVDRIIIIVNYIILTYFTLKFKQYLISQLQMFMSLNDSVNPLNTLPTQQADVQLQQFKKQDFIESQTSEAQMNIPKVVKRISKTYFGFDDLNSDKKNDQKGLEQIKKPIHHRALSSQVQKTAENGNEKIKLTSMVDFKMIENPDLDEQKENSILQQKQNQIRSISMSSINSCCVCYDNDSDALFMQCGHGGVCYHCALDMWKNKDECYLCRKKIERVLQIQICKNEKDIYQVVGATELNQKLKKKRQKNNQQQHDQ